MTILQCITDLYCQNEIYIYFVGIHSFLRNHVIVLILAF